MEKFIIDTTRLVTRFFKRQHPTGIDRVVIAYIKHYQTRLSAFLHIDFLDQWVFFSEKDSQALFDILTSDYKFLSVLKVQLLIIKSVLSKVKVKKGSVFLKLSHGKFDQKKYSSKIVRYKLKPIYLLHDLIPIEYSEYNRPGEDKKHHLRLQTMLKTGYGLIYNSEYTRSCFLNYANEKKLSLKPSVVAHLGVLPLKKPSQKKHILSPYFVILGTIEPRKNHLLLLNIWRRMVSEKHPIIPKLVIIGKRGWECEQVIDMLERCAAIKEHIIELNQCDDSDVSNYLYHSQALLFPTFTEGYGLPLVEALSLGVPVIASNLPVFREIAADVPEYLDPIDGLGWYHMIANYMNNDSFERKNQLARLKQYKPWGWENHFKMIDTFIENNI